MALTGGVDSGLHCPCMKYPLVPLPAQQERAQPGAGISFLLI
jgi:hypothetical protein